MNTHNTTGGLSRRTALKAGIVLALTSHTPATAAEPAPELPVDKVARLAEELAHALNDYAGGKFHAIVHPSADTDWPVQFRVTRLENDRVQIATSIERLIDMLDAMDGDENLEESGDEHDTGVAEGWRQSRLTSWESGRGYVIEDDEDGADAELTIASPELREGRSQHGWASGNNTVAYDEAEDGHDAEDNNDDLEPLLGWPDNRPDQTTGHGLGSEGEEFSACGHTGQWGYGDSQNDDDEDGHDREAYTDDNGIADADGLHALETFGNFAGSSPIKVNRSLGFDPALLPQSFVMQLEGT